MTNSSYGRGFPTPRERTVEMLTWMLCGASLMAIFVGGVIYVWPTSHPIPVLEHTHPELVR